MRKHYLDNMRWLVTVLLIPFHSFRVYDGLENFYIKGVHIPFADLFIQFLNPWFMPLMFVIAGASSRYALGKKSGKQYALERVRRLLIPFLAGLILLVPVQPYLAERFHNGYQGSYFAYYIHFFTQITDLSGYDGGFTPGHLWFILFLFLISLVALPIMGWGKRRGSRSGFLASMPQILVAALGLVPGAATGLLEFGGGYSMGRYLAFFLLGYFFLSNNGLEGRIERYRYRYGLAALSLWGLSTVFGIEGASGFGRNLYVGMLSWLGILAIWGFSRRLFNWRNRLSAGLSRASFSVYIFHQSWVVLFAYFVVESGLKAWPQVLLVIALSALFTYLSYILCRRFKATRFLFGVK